MKLLQVLKEDAEEVKLARAKAKADKIMTVFKNGTKEVNWGTIRWEIDPERFVIRSWGERFFLQPKIENDIESIKIWQVLDDDREILIDRYERDELFKNLFAHIQKIFGKFGVIIMP